MSWIGALVVSASTVLCLGLVRGYLRLRDWAHTRAWRGARSELEAAFLMLMVPDLTVRALWRSARRRSRERPAQPPGREHTP